MASVTRTGASNTQAGHVMIILGGPPGSGKSTFCKRVVGQAERPWVRVCQDVASAKGTRGSRQQCLKQALAAIQLGNNVLIDRCNMDEEQRADFLSLGISHGLELHAVFLNLPLDTCIARAAARTSHEGGVEGPNVGGLVRGMARKRKLPQLVEGFTRITICSNDEDVNAALALYGDPRGGGKQAPASPTVRGLEGASLTPQKLKDIRGYFKGAWCQNEVVARLAFPSLSTADFMFDHAQAADIITETAAEFLSSDNSAGLGLVFVDPSEQSAMMRTVRRKAEEGGLHPLRFQMVGGDIWTLRSEKGLECCCVATAAEQVAGGPECLQDTLSFTPVGPTSPLRIQQGVCQVIHVGGPNMNPDRPNWLGEDYVQGGILLRSAYRGLFRSFAEGARNRGGGEASDAGVAGVGGGRGEGEGGVRASAFTFLMQAAKQKSGEMKGGGQSGPPKKQSAESGDGIRVQAAQLPAGMSEQMEVGEKEEEEVEGRGEKRGGREAGEGRRVEWEEGTKRRSGGWVNALKAIAGQPEKHTEAVLESHELALVMRDLYPKARHHLLVVARAQRLDSVSDCGTEHLPTLRHMLELGRKWAERLKGGDGATKFRCGFHVVPSMRQLHMHVISQDFDSVLLKHKKHWNSFTTEFFVDVTRVIECIERAGCVDPISVEQAQECLKRELRCHRCHSVQPNIPRLKTHIKTCTLPCRGD